MFVGRTSACSPNAHPRMKWGSRCYREWPAWDTYGSYCFLIAGHIPPHTAWTSEELVSPPTGEQLREISLSSILKLYWSISLLSVVQMLWEVATGLGQFAITFLEIKRSAIQLEFFPSPEKIVHVIKDYAMVHIYERNKIKVGQFSFSYLLTFLPAIATLMSFQNIIYECNSITGL